MATLRALSLGRDIAGGEFRELQFPPLLIERFHKDDTTAMTNSDSSAIIILVSTELTPGSYTVVSVILVRNLHYN